jgi:hypothetical protein
LGDLMAAATRTVKVKFDGDTTGLAVAAKRGEQIVDKFADNSARTFTSRFRSWFTGRGADDANTVGRFFARTFGTGVLSGLSVPVFGPVFAGALLGIVAVAAPVIGAALASGVVLAFGAGLAGLGIVFAAQSQRVKDAFSDLKDSLVADLRDISQPFKSTLVDIAGFIQRTFTAFKPTLSAAFADLAPVLSTFADQFFAALEKFKPAVAAISDAFGDLLGALGPKLPDLFADISDTIVGIADTISAHSDTFASLITFAVDAADAMVEFVGALADTYVVTTKVVGVLNPLGHALRAVGLEGGNAANQLNLFGPALGTLGSTATGTAGQVADMGTKMAGSFDGVTIALKGTIDTFAGYTQSLEEYAAAQQAITDPIFALISAVTRADEAQTAYNEAVKEHGRTSAEASAAALAHGQAIAGLEQAALNGQISFEVFEQKLRGWVAAGALTAREADHIRARVAGARGEAEAFQGTYAATINLRDHATSALAGIRRWLDRIQSKTVTITARTQIPAGVSIRQLMERQHGGPVMPHRSYLVGEKGPEILTMGGQAGNVTPNHKIGDGGGWNERTIARAIAGAINGATLFIDDRGRGKLIAREADMFARAG